MSRRSTRQFHYREVQELSRQGLFETGSEQQRRLLNVERLHDGLDPDLGYPLEFVLFQIIGVRPASGSTVLFNGRELAEDLRLLVDQVSRRFPRRPEAAEACQTPAELAQRLRVSVKTLQRWRGLGLRWRWVLMPGRSRAQAVYPGSAVERFLALHQRRTERAAAYERLTPQQRRRLIDRARRIAQQCDVSLNRVAQHLARRTGKATQTLRDLLDAHDRAHPRDRIFVDRVGALDAWTRRVIARAVRWGVPASRIARRYRRTRSTVHRAVQEQRAATVRGLPLGCVVSPLFEVPESRAALEEPPRTDSPRALLLHYNYLKFRAMRRRDALHRYEPRAGDLDLIEADLARAGAVREKVFRAAMETVSKVARQHLAGRDDRSPATLLDLIERGHEVLSRAIEEFDITREQTFEANLTWRLMRVYANLPTVASKAHRKIDPAELQQRLETSASRWVKAPWA